MFGPCVSSCEDAQKEAEEVKGQEVGDTEKVLRIHSHTEFFILSDFLFELLACCGTCDDVVGQESYPSGERISMCEIAMSIGLGVEGEGEQT